MKINKKSVLGLTAVTLSMALWGCVKEKGVFEDGGSSGIVQLVLPARTSSTAIARAVTTVFEALDVVTLPLKVHLTGAQGAPEDLKLTFTTWPGNLNTKHYLRVYMPSTPIMLLYPKGQKKLF
ncbi:MULTISPECIES: hypothetical protein [Sphingobacterium]|uniref:hypothetical protein n=1 Tax=Sphingobacterium TaxID=28453 RepID=UPI002580F6EA|nr:MULTISPECIES: hypothetical protein [Sphingobacterium]